MPMRMARQMCAQAVFIRGDMELYSRYSRLVTDIIADSAPVYEKMSIDEHYLDLTGMDRFHDCQLWSHELRKKIIKETGLPISFGLSENKTVSKIATGQAKPNGELQVPTPYINDFLDPLSVQKILYLASFDGRRKNWYFAPSAASGGRACHGQAWPRHLEEG